MRLEETLDSIFLKTVMIFFFLPHSNSKLNFSWVGISWNLSLVLLALVGLFETCPIHASFMEIWAEYILRIWGYCSVTLFWDVSPYFPAVVTWTLSSNSSKIKSKDFYPNCSPCATLTWACPWVKSYKKRDITYCCFKCWLPSSLCMFVAEQI